ncbi:MAG: DNA primase noncatalytic subunit PriX [Desulfurococcales archaeon]|nr:DNA primase noncatalytic subunit PriX [Desulfurococcales archaeon]
MPGDWQSILKACSEGRCGGAEELLKEACSNRDMCIRRGRSAQSRYEWIETIIKRGVPDGRSRLILYVISRYLVNVKGLSDDEALATINDFLRASCEKHGNCGKIYQSWIRNVIRHVRRGGWKPWSLDRIKREDPELLHIIEKVLGNG